MSDKLKEIVIQTANRAYRIKEEDLPAYFALPDADRDWFLQLKGVETEWRDFAAETEGDSLADAIPDYPKDISEKKKR